MFGPKTLNDICDSSFQPKKGDKMQKKKKCIKTIPMDLQWIWLFDYWLKGSTTLLLNLVTIMERFGEEQWKKKEKEIFVFLFWMVLWGFHQGVFMF